MIDVNFRIICINVPEQTPYYRGNTAEIFDEFRDDYKYYKIDEYNWIGLKLTR